MFCKEMWMCLDWAVYDENGVCGVRDDAPEEVKQAYEEVLRMEKELLERL